jgi:polygalacturonase
MSALKFISTTRVGTSTITSQELFLYDPTLSSNVRVNINNGVLLVAGSQIQSGGAGGGFNTATFYSSISTYTTFTSTIQIGIPGSGFAAPGQFNLDCLGSGRFTQLVSTSQLITGAQYIGLQFG